MQCRAHVTSVGVCLSENRGMTNDQCRMTNAGPSRRTRSGYGHLVRVPYPLALALSVYSVSSVVHQVPGSGSRRLLQAATMTLGVPWARDATSRSRAGSRYGCQSLGPRAGTEFRQDPPPCRVQPRQYQPRAGAVGCRLWRRWTHRSFVETALWCGVPHQQGMPARRMLARRVWRLAALISQSGRRYSSAMRPRAARAALTGIGLVSTKRSRKKG